MAARCTVFSIVAPHLWNEVLENLRIALSLCGFWWGFKTFISLGIRQGRNLLGTPFNIGCYFYAIAVFTSFNCSSIVFNCF